MKNEIREFLREYNDMPLLLKGVFCLMAGFISILPFLLFILIVKATFTTTAVPIMIGTATLGFLIIKALKHFIKEN